MSDRERVEHPTVVALFLAGLAVMIGIDCAAIWYGEPRLGLVATLGFIGWAVVCVILFVIASARSNRKEGKERS